MVKNINVKLANMIEEYIISVPFLKSKFTHHNIKYSIGKLIDNIIIILKTGISYRNIQKYTKIHWNTIYKFKLKLVKYNIFEKLFNKTINTYITEMGNTSKLYYTDTTFICNKLGEDLASYNPQVKKHKTSKISIISDDFNIPISIKFDTGATHDVTILKEQLLDFHKNHPLLCNQTNTIIADGAYDSKPLHTLIKELNFKNMITNKNIRNLKDISKLDNLKLNKYNKMLLKKRGCVEHVINKFKQFKKIQLRYDRYSKNFISYIFMSALLIVIKNTWI